MLRSRNPDTEVGEVLQYRFIYYLITEERFKRNKKALDMGICHQPAALEHVNILNSMYLLIQLASFVKNGVF